MQTSHSCFSSLQEQDKATDGNIKSKIDRYFAMVNRATNVGFHVVTVF